MGAGMTKKYVASISMEFMINDIEEAKLEGLIDEQGNELEDKIREELGDRLFDVIEDMVLNRQPFHFDFKVVEESKKQP